VERVGIFNWAPDGLDRLREPDWHFVQPKSGEGVGSGAEEAIKPCENARRRPVPASRGWVGNEDGGDVVGL